MIDYNTIAGLRGLPNLVGLFIRKCRAAVHLFLALGVCLHTVNAQKVVKKSFVNSDIHFIQVDASNCFEIDMETSDTDQMVIKATIDGEYKSNLLLTANQVGSTMMINAGFQPNFKNPNDKLSAHKVVSIALKILLPEYKNVLVFGTNCNVTASGFYENLKVTLSDGQCNLNRVSETVEINTQSGNIVASYDEAKVTAETKYGKVEKDVIPEGNNRYTLRTVTGDILLKRIE